MHFNKKASGQQIQFNCNFVKEDHKEQFLSEHVIFYLISGTIKFQDYQKEYICKAGDYWYCYKNQFLKYQKLPEDRDTPCKYIAIELDQQLLKKIAQEQKLRAIWMEEQPGVIMINHNASLALIFSSLLGFEHNPASIKKDFKLAKMEAATLILLDMFPHLKNTLFNFAIPTKKVFDSYMHNNFHFNVSLQQFAYMSGRSISTFKRDFAKTFKMTPKKWLVDKRMLNAYNIISNEGKSSREIYFKLGFGSESHFCYAFKKYFDFNPTDLLKKRQ